MLWIFAILSAVKPNGTFVVADFVYPPNKAKNPRNSFRNALRNLRCSGHLVCISPGIYRRTDKPLRAGSKGEQRIAHYLDSLGLKYEREYKSSLRGVGGGLLRYDFLVYIGDRVVVIEFHGIQHYQKVARYGGTPAFEKRQLHDAMKERHAEECGREVVTWNDENQPLNTPQAAAYLGVSALKKARRGLNFQMN